MSDSNIIGYMCPLCNTPNPEAAKYCVKCGHWLFDTNYEAKPLTKKEYKKYFGNTPKVAASSETEVSSNKSLFGWLALIFVFFIGPVSVKMGISFLVPLLGIVSIIKPLKFLGIKNRLMGVVVLILGFTLIVIAGSYLPHLTK